MRSLCMRRITWPKSRGSETTTYWNPLRKFVYSLYNSYGATMTIKGSLLSRVPTVSDFGRRFSKSAFHQKSTFGALNRRLILPMLLAIELALLCQICELHFKFEEDRTKTAVAIESNRYSFGQTHTSNWFYTLYNFICHKLHWTDKNVG